MGIRPGKQVLPLLERGWLERAERSARPHGGGADPRLGEHHALGLLGPRVHAVGVLVLSGLVEQDGEQLGDLCDAGIAFVAGVEVHLVERGFGQMGTEPAAGPWVAAVAELDLLEGLQGVLDRL